MKKYDVVIVGGGPAGMSAALYCSRAGLRTLLIEKNQLGGQLNQTDRIENYIGVGNIDASLLSLQMKQQIPHHVEILFGNVVDIQKDLIKVKRGRKSFEVEYSNLILATGVSHKELDLREFEMNNFPISYCATCDGNFYEGLNVAVVGGGDSAFEEALYLSNISKKVTILSRSKSRAKSYLKERVKEKENIQIVEYEPILHIDIEDGKAEINKTCKFLFDGIFVCIGIKPNNSLLEKISENFDIECMDNNGYAVVDNNLKLVQTNNIYVAGDLRQPEIKQLVNAVADASIISKQLTSYL